MSLPFTQKILMDWAGATVFRDARALFDRGAVRQAEYTPPVLKGAIAWGNREIKTAARVLDDRSCENLCPCRDSTERGIICAHVVAVGLELLRRASDPERERLRLEEARRAARQAALAGNAFIRRAGPDEQGVVHAGIRIELAAGWEAGAAAGRVPILAYAEYRGGRQLLDQVPRDLPLHLSRKDEAILFVLEDICEGPARGRLELALPDFINLLELHVGRPLFAADHPEPLTVNAARMQSVLRMDLDHENGELILMIHTELPFLKPAEFPLYITTGRAGWVYGAGHFWPLANLLPDPLRAVYREPVSVPREAVPHFLKAEAPLLGGLMTVESDISLDLFTIEPETPRLRLVVRGSPASLAATLSAEYAGGLALVAGKADPRGHFAHPDPADLLRYTVRNPAAEAAALECLARAGFTGDCGDALEPIVGCREVHNFLGRQLPALRRRGWKVEFEGRVGPHLEALDFVTPVVRITDAPGGEWFEVNFEFDDGRGGSLSPAEIQRALLKNEAFIERDGRTILLDSGAVEAMRDVFADCASGEGGRPGSFRMAGIYAAYVKESLDALDGVDIEAAPHWRELARRQNRELDMEPVCLPAELEAILRGYQREGVTWLRFLEANGFCGILADEMGLGKTLQTLVWLQLQRSNPLAQGKPALIVCPTSLVENWAEEARRFVPQLKVLTVTGGDRREKWGEIERADLVVTSYALLRRDIEEYVSREFAVAVLDEAQHIKNRSTQNAIAAKRLRTVNRLVLTGTPIENSVTDLWSIMDYLMPDYLGSHEAFRHHYEQPIAAGGPEAEAAHAKLRRKLRPFLLRRMKRDVAKDLPPKIERTAWCALTVDQQRVYREMLEASRRQVGDLVSQHGFQRSRMEILKILLRLRQICCHLELLNLAELRSEFPSAKMELFFELLDEACDAGHRVLVFSQFVSMLSILRRELERREMRYCYLDGATRERMKIVHEFNTNRAIPLFLISLKAGGTGLNLTGADMVIHFDPWWNPAVENQATDRAYRIGQKRTVYSVKLITRGTVEEKVLAMQQRKKAVIDATLETDEQVMGVLNWDDVRELLEL